MTFTNTSDILGVQETLDALVTNTLTELNQDDITYLGNYALDSHTTLTSVNFPNVVISTSKNRYVFRDCTGLISATFSKLEEVPTSMFASCTALTTVNFPMAKKISSSAFEGCSSLETINLPNVTELGSYCFHSCEKLKNVVFGEIKTIPANVFQSCEALTNFDFSNIITLSNYSFSNSGLIEAILPKVSSIPSYGFYSCDNLKFVDIAITNSKPSISTLAFANSNLSHLIIRYPDDVASITSRNVFNYTPIASGLGAIYVPTELVNTYKSATNWSDFSDQIFSINNYPVTDFGTITDNWSDIFDAEEDGTYSTKYNIGDTKSVLIDGTPVMMQIVAFDEDVSKITWLCRDIYSQIQMNSTNTVPNGWVSSELRSYLENNILPNIQNDVRENIVAVDKTYYTGQGTLISNDSIWIPSSREVMLSSNIEDSGVQYNLFNNEPIDGALSSRIKRSIQSGYSTWWLRSYAGNNNNTFRCINSSGVSTNSWPTATSVGLVFGFCT